MPNQKHMSLEDRNYIEQALNQNMSFKEIAKFLCKDPTTIAKEVKKHKIRKEPNTFNNESGNVCTKRFLCEKKNVCGLNCTKKCARCNKCNKFCSDFEEEICPALKTAPYVCNPCKNKGSCRLVKFYYRAMPSYKQYKNLLSTSRQGPNISDEELTELDNLVSPALKDGQSISHIFDTQEIPCCKTTLYNYVSANLLTARNIDLPRKVRMSSRKSKRSTPKDSAIRKGRTYQDFQKYLLDNPDSSVVEMDTVEGKKVVKFYLPFCSVIQSLC